MFMEFENISIGVDIEEISRFEGKERGKDANFLARIFTEKELDYCYKNKNYASHLCGKYCAKEAAVKALTNFNINNVYYGDIEILNKDNGIPFVNLPKYPDIKFKVSVSHSKLYATATVLALKD